MPDAPDPAGPDILSLRSPLPGPLSGKGVTIEQVASYAEAAVLFMAAEPWRHLEDDDPIRVESPAGEPGVRFASVMGQAGYSYGLLFHRDIRFFQERDEELLLEAARQGFWSLSFDSADETPPEDLDLWARHGFSLAREPLAHEPAYPVAVYLGGPVPEIRRPDARLLGLFEGILRALAATTEDEMDSGRWEKEVATHNGPLRLVLSLPLLLDPSRAGLPIVSDTMMERALLEVHRRFAGREDLSAEEIRVVLQEQLDEGDAIRPSLGDEERAQELAFEARGARGRRRIALARQALKLWPDCADAYVVLADRESEIDRARDLYESGVAAGERALGPERFRDGAGCFWGLVETRPYMRARYGLAEVLWEMGARDEAVEHFRELLRLNPNDAQGARYRLANALLILRRNDELARLLDAYPDEDSVDWSYNRALLVFIREGDSPGARSRLTAALRRNRFVPKYLLLGEPLPPVPAMYLGMDEEAEAMSYASLAVEAWEGTPGALGWLQRRVPVRASRGGRKGGGKRKKK